VLDVVRVLERVVALLWREDLVVVSVDGGLARRAVGHQRDWDSTGAQPPGAGHLKSGDVMYLASYRRRVSHSWMYWRPKPFAS
jgi:hypothetical protein